VEKDVLKFIWKYYDLISSKSNISERDKLGLLYVLSYIKLFKSESYQQFKNKGFMTIQEFIHMVRESAFDPGSESRDPENMRFVISELERISYSLDDLRGIVELFDDATKDLIIEVFKTNLEYIYRGGKDIEYTPNNINKLVLNILDVDEKDSIMDIGSGFGDFLVNAYVNANPGKISGIEINNYSYDMSKLRMSALTYKFNLMNSDVFEMSMDEKYSKVFCNYPWGFKMDKMRLDRILWQLKNMRFNWGKAPGSSMDWLFINSMLTMLRHDGKAVAIIPDGPLFKTADNEYKSDLINSGLIEMIIKLPERIFPYTGIVSNIVVFSNDNDKVKFVDASDLVSGDNRRPQLDVDGIKELLNKQQDDRIGYADKQKIEENGFVLTVDYYLSNSEIKYHNPKKLSEYILDIFRGLQITPSEIEELSDPKGEYEILRISDIEDGFISDNLTRINVEKNKYDRYLIQNNDVIITSKGTRIKIAVAEIGNRKIIANGNLIVLRVDEEKINPYYLAMYLLSKEGTTILNRIQTGRAIISINPGKLSEITISTIDFEKQNEVAKKYQCIQQQLLFAKKHLNDLMRNQEEFFDREVVRMFDVNE